MDVKRLKCRCDIIEEMIGHPKDKKMRNHFVSIENYYSFI